MSIHVRSIYILLVQLQEAFNPEIQFDTYSFVKGLQNISNSRIPTILLPIEFSLCPYAQSASPENVFPLHGNFTVK